MSSGERKRGGQPGNSNAPTTHGARSQASVSHRAGYAKQSVLMRLGLRQSDLEPGARYLLDRWARLEAELWLYDRYIDQHGLVDEAGNPRGFELTRQAARNAALRAFRALEPRLLEAAAAKSRAQDPVARLLGGRS